MEPTKIVEICYQDLCLVDTCSSNEDATTNTLLSKLGQAFGSEDECLGILLVTNLPQHYTAMRERVLTLTHKLGSLSSKDLDAVTVEESLYQVGWSHGKEKLSNNVNDTAKGSFYFNPLVEESLLDAVNNRDGEKAQTQGWIDDPAVTTPNVWPQDSLPELQAAAMEMGQYIIKVGHKIALLCDLFVSKKCPTYKKWTMYETLTNSLFCKGRLLHYFPKDSQDNVKNAICDSVKSVEDYGNWCGWHNDHGSLTGLVPAMYFNSDGAAVHNNFEILGGLHIKSRSGKIHRVAIPDPDSTLAFQVGETTQIVTGGVLQATPHAVHQVTTGLSRESMAVFMEPEYWQILHVPDGYRDQVQSLQAQLALPKTVRTLKSRFTGSGMTFGQFSYNTFQAFY